VQADQRIPPHPGAACWLLHHQPRDLPLLNRLHRAIVAKVHPESGECRSRKDTEPLHLHRREFIQATVAAARVIGAAGLAGGARAGRGRLSTRHRKERLNRVTDRLWE